MALYLRKTLGNGVAVEYHRVVRVDGMTNVQTTIEVASYTSAEKRAEEKAALSAGDPMDVYTETSFHAAPWSESGMSCAQAYEWLKQQDEFEGASDVMEDGQEGGGA